MSKLEGQVCWEYVSGRGVYGDPKAYDVGFGSLWQHPTVGSSMLIVGNSGIMTSLVQEVTEEPEGSFLVKTLNSVYRIRKTGKNG